MKWPWMLAAAGLLCAASPPAWVPGTGPLVLFGWMAFYALVTAENGAVAGAANGAGGTAKRKRSVYLVGVAHMLWFSFSLRHVMLPAYIAVALVGGLYYVLCSVWTRALGRCVPTSIAFGLALAGVHWLRAHFHEIQYPHVQPAHCLYEWPVLLGGLRWGSEVFVNVLIGAFAGASVDLWRAWRVARPRFRPAWIVWASVALVILAGSLFAPSVDAQGTRTVRLLLFEPRLQPFDWERRAQRILQRVFLPTWRLAGPGAENPPDLVVWPESVALRWAIGTPESPNLVPLPYRPAIPWRGLAPGTRLIEGSALRREGARPRVIGLLVDHRGQYLGHHEKQHVVPGGEHQPFLDYLPTSWGEGIRKWFEAGMGVPLPETDPGTPRPLLETARGDPFGVMICYDNAFPDVAQDLAARGAAFGVVISNENWYRGGAELEQMVAMTVCRALESSMAIVRCTVDGASVVVHPDGRVGVGLPYPPESYEQGENLTVELEVPVQPVRTVTPLRRPVTWVVWLSLLAWIAPLLGSRATLRQPRSPVDEAPSGDPGSPVSGP